MLEFIRYVNRHDHGEMVRGLQRLESILVIEHVVPRLVGETRTIPIFDAARIAYGVGKGMSSNGGSSTRRARISVFV